MVLKQDMNADSTSPVTEQVIRLAQQADADLSWDRDGFALPSSGVKSHTLCLDGEQTATQVWHSKQDNALSEYLDSHVEEQISPTTHSLYKLFGAYIGAALHGPDEKARPNVLDVGCGIGRMQPCTCAS